MCARCPTASGPWCPAGAARKLHVDLPLLVLLLVLTAYGLLVLYSASGQRYGSGQRQGRYFLLAYAGHVRGRADQPRALVALVPLGLCRRRAAADRGGLCRCRSQGRPALAGSRRFPLPALGDHEARHADDHRLVPRAAHPAAAVPEVHRRLPADDRACPAA
jgi:hypothetical protein